MNNWKKAYKKKVLDGSMPVCEFIETEIIEKLIEDVLDYQSATGVYLREKEQLKAKWLGKETNEPV